MRNIITAFLAATLLTSQAAAAPPKPTHAPPKSTLGACTSPYDIQAYERGYYDHTINTTFEFFRLEPSSHPGRFLGARERWPGKWVLEPWHPGTEIAWFFMNWHDDEQGHVILSVWDDRLQMKRVLEMAQALHHDPRGTDEDMVSDGFMTPMAVEDDDRDCRKCLNKKLYLQDYWVLRHQEAPGNELDSWLLTQKAKQGTWAMCDFSEDKSKDYLLDNDEVLAWFPRYMRHEKCRAINLTANAI